MSIKYNHVRNKRGENKRGMEILIREEVEHQDWLESAGYWSQTWKVLRALQSLLSATQLQAADILATDTATFPECSPPPACDNASTACSSRWQSCG